MKKFTCNYLKENGLRDDKFPEKKFEAASVEEAAHIFAEEYPSENLRIGVSWGLTGHKILSNRERAQQLRLEREEKRANEKRRAREAEERQRLESLQKLHSSVESADGNLAGLTYIELSALVENLKEFPSVRDKISPEECAVREELYKMAFFDRKLQAGLQTEQAELQTKQAELQTSLLNQIASGQPTAGAAGPGKSNLARNAAMLGGVAALQKLNQIEENTGDVSEGLGFD